MHKLIWSEEQVLNFVSILKPLTGDEAYFLSLSARNKYLSDEERKALDLGRTEMFARKLVKQDLVGGLSTDFVFLRTLKTMEVAEGGYTSRSGKVLPSKCMVAYANINPTSGFKALRMFTETTTKMLFDTCTDPESILRINSLDTILMNCYQKVRSTKYLIDVDFDIPDEGTPLVSRFCKVMSENGVEYHVIKTKSGFHVLLKRDTLKFNYTKAVAAANEEAGKTFGEEHVEVVINTNEMVPIPGTIQADFKVCLLG